MVWVGALVISAIYSLAKKARQGTAPAPPRRSTGMTAVRAPAPVAVAPQSVPAAPPPEPAASPGPVQVIRVARVGVVTPQAAPPQAAPRTDGTPVFRGMFQRENLVRAVIAAEVLGPPRALQEHSIWSPRHSEASI